MSVDGKFVFILDGFKEKYLYQFRLCLHSLRTRGGRGRDLECVLVYLAEPQSEIERFCRDYHVTLQPEQLFAPYPRWNKPLMCRVRRGDAICLLDMDVLFAGDPTPAFERCVQEQKVLTRPAGAAPLQRHIREPWLRPLSFLYHLVGRHQWRSLFLKRGLTHGIATSPPMMQSGRGQWMLPNHNTAVTLIPQGYVASLGEVWEEAVRDLIAVRERNGFLARYLSFEHTNQIAFGIAMHAAGVPWELIDWRYHFHRHRVAPEERSALARGEAAIAHYAGLMQQYLRPEDPGLLCPEHAEMHALAREIVGEVFERGARAAV